MKHKSKGYYSNRKKSLSILLGIAIITAPFSHIESASAQNLSIKGEVILGEDIQWMASKISSNQNKFTVDTSNHFPMLIQFH